MRRANDEVAKLRRRVLPSVVGDEGTKPQHRALNNLRHRRESRWTPIIDVETLENAGPGQRDDVFGAVWPPA